MAVTSAVPLQVQPETRPTAVHADRSAPQDAAPISAVAYLTNCFPAATEPYVIDEIRELRRRGVRVVPGSARSPLVPYSADLQDLVDGMICLQRVRPFQFARATWLCLRNLRKISDILKRPLLEGQEPLRRRVAALLHTWLGSYYALLLSPLGVEHIHVHHGYFSAWIAMVAARLLGISYSVTLHGSDLLLHGFYLDTKLENCRFCVTISEFNRRYLLEHYPQIAPEKIIVQRTGVDSPDAPAVLDRKEDKGAPFVLLSVGRLHPVKDHAFLLRACRRLKDRGLPFACLLAGDGPARTSIERLLRDLDLQGEVRLLGHISHAQLTGYYAVCDLVVLTSRSEGIPLALMEAMAHGRPALAPAITGIPELVTDGRTGFLYRPGSIEDFVANVETASRSRSALGPVGRAARRHVLAHFHREKNLAAFCDCFLEKIMNDQKGAAHEGALLQQI